ncbi:NAD(P)H-quinone oxidoreductase subunit D4, partial [filamentous cyanobacterium Phorm 46]
GSQPAWLLKWSESTTNAIVATLPTDKNAQIAISYPWENSAIEIASTQTKSAYAD